MMNLLCSGAITLLLGLTIFFYLLNTVGKKTPALAPTNDFEFQLLSN